MLCSAQVLGTQVRVPHTPAMPPPPQVSPMAHEPHSIWLPQPSPAGPQAMCCAMQVRGTHWSMPQRLAVPPPPQLSGAAQVPQLAMRLPQPSPAGPHCTPSSAQVLGVQVGTSGVMQELRSKIMNSRSFSCGVIGPPAHSAGKIMPSESPTFSTWKSSKSTRPHCWLAGTPMGVLKV